MTLNLKTSRAGCKSCGADVLWVETRKGKRMPLDPEENSAGNVVIEADGKAAVLPPGAQYSGPRYASHFETCPDAQRWRRKR